MLRPAAPSRTHSWGMLAQADTPVWMMAIAGVFVALGVNFFGHRVIRTMGEELTEINCAPLCCHFMPLKPTVAALKFTLLTSPSLLHALGKMP